jgi:CheY-like chemotaxis protein
MASGTNRRQRDILLVTGSPEEGERLDRLLRQAFDASWNVHPAATLDQAIAALETRSFDVLLLNLALSDSRGPETLSRLQALGPPPTILLVDGNSPSLAEALSHRTVQACLPRALQDPLALKGAVLVALERARVEEQLRQGRDKYSAII